MNIVEKIEKWFFQKQDLAIAAALICLDNLVATLEDRTLGAFLVNKIEAAVEQHKVDVSAFDSCQTAKECEELYNKLKTPPIGLAGYIIEHTHYENSDKDIEYVYSIYPEDNMGVAVPFYGTRRQGYHQFKYTRCCAPLDEISEEQVKRIVEGLYELIDSRSGEYGILRDACKKRQNEIRWGDIKRAFMEVK